MLHTWSTQCSAVFPSIVTAAHRFLSSLSSVHSVATAPAPRAAQGVAHHAA